MSQQKWEAVDSYFQVMLAPEADELAWVIEANSAAGLPSIDVSPLQGKFLKLLVGISKAKRILEIGTLGGYSTIWMAQALPSHGKLVSLELENNHVLVAEKNLRQAQLDHIVEIIPGPGLSSLQQMIENQEPAFDLVFVDADKPNNPNYLERALQLTKPGSVIVFDNVVREGEVVDPDSIDENVAGVRQLTELIAKSDRIDATVIQTLGIKGYDGFLIAKVTE